jgi:hypothetical protein
VLTNFIKPQPIASTKRLKNYCDEQVGSLVDDQESLPQHSVTEFPYDDLNSLSAIPSDFVAMIKRSCLNATLKNHLMNDSGKLRKSFPSMHVFLVLDISKHAVLYEAVVGLLLAICSSPPIYQVPGHELVPALDHMSDLILEAGDDVGGSVYERLKKLSACVDVYMSKLIKSNEPSTSSAAATVPEQEEGLYDLLEVAKQATSLMDQRTFIGMLKYCLFLGNQDRRQRYREHFERIDEEERMEEQRRREIVPDEKGYTTGQSLENLYLEVMKPLQFGKRHVLCIKAPDV